MASLVMAANMNNMGVATPNKPMHPCKVCNKELDNEKALWLHMRSSHGIHHYYTGYHSGYLDQRRKLVSALPSCLQSTTLKDGFQDPKDPNMANCLVLLSNGTLKPLAVVLMESSHDGTRDLHASVPEPIRVRDQSIEIQGKGKFECKACNKVFTSHQALGGHRASHKKVKGCFAANVVASNLENDENDGDEPTMEGAETTTNERVPIPKKSNKSHECSICHKVFPSGQALGGHKRCHWLPYTIPPPPPPPQTITIPSPPQTLKFHNFFDVDESRPHNMSSNKKPRYTIISSPPDGSNQHRVAPKLGFALDISAEINASCPSVTFLGSMTKKTTTSNYYQSRHCAYKCNTSLSLFNDEDLMPLKMQWEGKSSSWLHLGIASSTPSEETA